MWKVCMDNSEKFHALKIYSLNNSFWFELHQILNHVELTWNGYSLAQLDVRARIQVALIKKTTPVGVLGI